MPTFPGGDAALLKFLGSKLNYPTAALDHHLSGKVYLTFTVDPEGHLHDPHVVRGLGSGLDEEALRLVRLMPWWNPGKIHGQPVWVTMTMPIVFRAL
jgi:protein TonB